MRALELMKLFPVRGAIVAACDEAGLFDAFDLGHAAVVDGDLDRAEAEVGDIPSNDFKPVDRRTVGGRGFRGDRAHQVLE